MKRLVSQIQIFQDITIFYLSKVHVVVSDGPEWEWSIQHDKFIDETSRLFDCLCWSDRYGCHKPLWRLLTDRFDGGKERGSRRDPVVRKDDHLMFHRGDRSALPVLRLPASDLATLFFHNSFELFSREPKFTDCIWIEVDVPSLAESAKRIFWIIWSSDLSSNEDVQWQVEGNAQLISHCDAASRKRENHAGGIFTILEELCSQTSPRLLPILQDHRKSFLSYGTGSVVFLVELDITRSQRECNETLESTLRYSRPPVVPTPIMNIATATKTAISHHRCWLFLVVS